MIDKHILGNEPKKIDRIEKWITFIRGVMIDAGINESEFDNNQVVLWFIPHLAIKNDVFRMILLCPTNEQQLNHAYLQLSALEVKDEYFNL